MNDNFLYWTYDGAGEWTADSRYHDEGVHFVYRIVVCDDGTFDVSQSDQELVGKHGPHKCFDDLSSAKLFCCAKDTEYQPEGGDDAS